MFLNRYDIHVIWESYTNSFFVTAMIEGAKCNERYEAFINNFLNKPNELNFLSELILIFVSYNSSSP